MVLGETGRVGEGRYTPPVSVRCLSLGLHYKTRLCVYVLEAKACKWHLQATLIHSMALIKWIFKTALRKANLSYGSAWFGRRSGRQSPEGAVLRTSLSTQEIWIWWATWKCEEPALFVTRSSSKTTWQFCRRNAVFWGKMSFSFECKKNCGEGVYAFALLRWHYMHQKLFVI